MEKAPIIKLSDSINYRGKYLKYTISFFDTHLNIKSDVLDQNIDYSKLSKLKYTEKMIIIVLKDSSDLIKMQCTPAEIKKIKLLFKSISDVSVRECIASARIEFGSLIFFVCINSTSFQELKSTIIKKIAKFFYPAFHPDEIFYDKFKDFKLKLKIESSLKSEINDSEDLDAALRYFNNKIDISVSSAKLDLAKNCSVENL